MEFDFPKIEEKILKFWQERQIFEKLRKKNQGKKRWSFLDGPITANNPMGVHHAWGRTYKDLFQRYKAMQGFDQRYQNGFDCQGLWVEVEVEKELGFKTKKDIEKYGVEKFVEACKERVRKYSRIQTQQSIRLGQWMDWGDWQNGLGNSYYTMTDENNYSIWHFLKKCREKDLLYKGRDVVPWCLRCGTAISQHEILTEEYKELTHKSIFIKLAVVGQKNTFLLVWTTTPWTLPANVAAAVHPDLVYAKVRDEGGDTLIFLKDKASLIPKGEIIEEFPGKKMEGLNYKGMFDELDEVKDKMKGNEHKIVLWEEVTADEGTGIVHIAPGCGQEDFQLSKKEKLAIIDPLNEESRYREGFGFLSGKLVTDVRDLIFEDLTKKEFVYKIEDYTHRYPTCWRCKTELIFRLVDEWYISMEKLRKPLMDFSEKISWIPGFGLERELDWLKNMQDWLISKKRYWGLALPIFECRNCNNFEVIGSKEELKERAVEGWKDFEGHSPHKPWIDEVKIRCSKCGEIVSRIPDVGNPWLDAGIVPFSTYIDPVTKKVSYTGDKKYWEKWFPADFICESFPGQFKNWFYSMIVMSAVLEETNPVKTIFGYASVRDEKGEEMHKSKGNAIWLDDAVEKIGADPMRWMYTKQNPVNNLNFGYTPANETKKKLLILCNVFAFFNTYMDKAEIPSEGVVLSSGNKLDLWILSRLNNLIKDVTCGLDEYDAAGGAGAIEDFFINDLSLWYLRRSRKRFHEDSTGRREAINTLYCVLLNLAKIIAPIMPFLAEELYSMIKIESMPESVHLFDWPISDPKYIDTALEEDIFEARKIVTLALAERALAGIKVRQPLNSLKIKSRKLAGKKEVLDIIREELNVNEIIHDATIEKDVELDLNITEKLKEEGLIREFVRQVQEMRKEAGFTPKDKILIQCFGSNGLNGILEKNKKIILSETKSQDLIISEKLKNNFIVEKEINIGDGTMWLGINK